MERNKILLILIAAIVVIAAVIGFIIISFSYCLDCGGFYFDPSQEAARLVKNYEGRPGNYGQTGVRVIIFKQGDEIASKHVAAASNVGLSTEQVCLSKGDFENSEGFELAKTPNNLLLVYSGSQLKAGIGIVCDDGLSIKADLESFNSNISACDINFESPQTYCVLMLRKD